MSSSPSSQSPPKIYTSHLPPVQVAQQSVWSFLFHEDSNSSSLASPASASTHEVAPPSPPDDNYLSDPDANADSAVAYIDFDTSRSLTFYEVKKSSLRLAWGLKRTMGLKKGDFVMFFSPNSLAWPIVLFGCVAVGLRITFAPCTSTARELAAQYEDSRPKVLFAARQLLEVTRRMFALVREEMKFGRVVVMDLDSGTGGGSDKQSRTERELCDLIKEDAGQLLLPEPFDGSRAEETVFVCYSSGTTGKPKGVETSHKNVCTVLRTTQAVWKGCEAPHDVYIAILPFYHIFGLLMLLHYPPMRRRPVVLLSDGFKPETFCQAVQKYRVTTVCLVPPIMQALATDPCVENYDLSSLTNLTSGASFLSAQVANKCLSRLRGRGAKSIIAIQGCGSTETSCPALIVPPRDSVRKFGCVGVLVPNLEARLVHEDGSDVQDGERGEMWVRGPTVFKGYLNRVEGTQEAFANASLGRGLEEGRGGRWYKTGDMMRVDEEGYWYIVDRKKEMIKWKGIQIAPAEIEAILSENEEVGDVGVVGVPDGGGTGDELVRAYIRPSNPTLLQDTSTKYAFQQRIEIWFRGQVGYPKWLRGGVRAVEVVPKG
ncbi:AMP binding protein [Ephemerocybe angulata]|uniref:AMP binding protein n=1 Tax=Ephemerocybe angulata TaxID=980116 RepID=A0A8H6M1K9_9AGAR|nr:AMP binding protein [Tulosesus angulatus]